MSNLRIKSCPSAHYNTRPEAIAIEALVIHAMNADEYPGKELELEACIKQLDDKKVSAHYLISRSGEVYQMVAEEMRAWHAGVSQLRLPEGHRSGLNDFSIGIELIGRESEGFTEVQYSVLALLTKEIMCRHPLRYVAGHEQVALPAGRKTDPGPNFDWDKFKTLLTRADKRAKDLVFY